jgi:glycolate oxidase
VTNGSLLTRLRRIVGSEHLVTHERQLATYESDGLLQYAARPVAVVLLG